MRTRMIAAVVLAAGAALLSGCGGSGSSEDAKSAGAAPSSAQTPADQMTMLVDQLRRAGVCDTPQDLEPSHTAPVVEGHDRAVRCPMINSSDQEVWRVLVYTFPTDEAKEAAAEELYDGYHAAGGYQSSMPGQRWIVLVQPEYDRERVEAAVGGVGI